MNFTLVNKTVSIDETNFSVFAIRHYVHTYLANKLMHTNEIRFITH